MNTRHLDDEIQIVRKIIDQLNKCLGIFIAEKMHRDKRNTLKDIAICKAELKRLITAKEAEKEAAKGASHDVAKRGRTAVQ
jgi:hypothetical protein